MNDSETDKQTITKAAPEKQKNPKRVAQGKRLSEISKAAKTRKRAELESTQQAQRDEAQRESKEDEESIAPSLSTTVAVVSIVSMSLGAYIGWKKYTTNAVDVKVVTQKHDEQATMGEEPPKRFRNLDNDRL